MFIVSVDRAFEAAHTNGPPEGKCATMHGHSWQLRLEVAMPDSALDEWGWTMDFSQLKKIVDQYDHKTLNGMPGLDKPSAEHLAMELYRQIDVAAGDRHLGITVRIDEGHGNSLTYLGPDEDRK